jgi:hypothetical protein
MNYSEIARELNRNGYRTSQGCQFRLLRLCDWPGGQALKALRQNDKCVTKEVYLADLL